VSPTNVDSLSSMLSSFWENLLSVLESTIAVVLNSSRNALVYFTWGGHPSVLMTNFWLAAVLLSCLGWF
jgi:hypothetical protein